MKLVIDRQTFELGPWRRTAWSYLEGEPPHDNRTDAQREAEPRFAAYPVWRDSSRTDMLIVRDVDGCEASVDHD